MKNSFWTSLRNTLRRSNRWVKLTAQRALDLAYEAALRIKAIEDEYFEGGQISLSSDLADRYSQSIQTYFQSELSRCLTTARLRLAEFKASNTLVDTNDPSLKSRKGATDPVDNGQLLQNTKDQAASVLEKLKFIDATLMRYRNSARSRNQNGASSVALTRIDRERTSIDPEGEGEKMGRNGTDSPRRKLTSSPRSRASGTLDRDLIQNVERVTDKTGILPRSILGTINRIKKELSPQAEDEVVKDFQTSKIKTVVALRFILLLILIPLLTQQLTKNFVVGPIVDRLRSQETAEIFLNLDMEESAFHELQQFEEKLRFESLISSKPQRSPQEIEEEVRKKASSIATEYISQSNDAIKNIFADLFSVATFSLLLIKSKRSLDIFKSFIDDIIYGLSDSAKAFIIILFTDIFVGFHSPHGWEVLLEGICRHLGLPESREFIFIFIATFPVILDTIFKYWIFRYLNRISPSAVATYKNMNE